MIRKPTFLGLRFVGKLLYESMELFIHFVESLYDMPEKCRESFVSEENTKEEN